MDNGPTGYTMPPTPNVGGGITTTTTATIIILKK